MKVSTVLGFVAAFGTALAAPADMAKREPVVAVAAIPILQPLADLLVNIQICVGVISKNGAPPLLLCFFAFGRHFLTTNTSNRGRHPGQRRNHRGQRRDP